jgi:hypothetical protein
MPRKVKDSQTAFSRVQTKNLMNLLKLSSLTIVFRKIKTINKMGLILSEASLLFGSSKIRDLLCSNNLLRPLKTMTKSKKLIKICGIGMRSNYRLQNSKIT